MIEWFFLDQVWYDQREWQKMLCFYCCSCSCCSELNHNCSFWYRIFWIKWVLYWYQGWCQTFLIFLNQLMLAKKAVFFLIFVFLDEVTFLYLFRENRGCNLSLFHFYCPFLFFVWIGALSGNFLLKIFLTEFVKSCR